MKKVIGISLLVLALACHRRPVESTAGSTDTVQPSSTGTTATETGGGAPLTTTTGTMTTTASTTGNSSGSGSNGTSGTLPAGAPPTATH
jgi:hypothetical protein